MSRITTLIKKEFKEFTRTYKLLILLVVFLIIGITSPLATKYLPEIIKMSAGESYANMIPKMGVEDVYTQYMKNFTQLGILALIFLIMGMVSMEKEKGTAFFVLVKPVTPLEFLFSKLIILWFCVLLGIIASALICGFYTFVLFKTLDIEYFVVLNLNLVLYCYFFSSTFLFISAMVKSQLTSGVFSFVMWVLISIVSEINVIRNFMPSNIIKNGEIGILSGEPFIGTGILFLVFGFIAYRIFSKWEDA